MDPCHINRMSLTIQFLHIEPSKYGCCPTISTFEDLQPRHIISMSISPSFTLFTASEKFVLEHVFDSSNRSNIRVRIYC